MHWSRPQSVASKSFAIGPWSKSRDKHSWSKLSANPSTPKSGRSARAGATCFKSERGRHAWSVKAQPKTVVDPAFENRNYVAVLRTRPANSSRRAGAEAIDNDGEQDYDSDDQHLQKGRHAGHIQRIGQEAKYQHAIERLQHVA
jgi:hypothetical protein